MNGLWRMERGGVAVEVDFGRATEFTKPHMKLKFIWMEISIFYQE